MQVFIENELAGKSIDYFQIIKLLILKRRKEGIGQTTINIVEPGKAIFFYIQNLAVLSFL